MLTSAAQDRVFYRVDGPPGQFITGYQTLPSLAEEPGTSTTFADATFRGEPIRIAALRRSASTGINSVPFVVTVAETTIARRQLAQTILVRSALRLGMMIAGAAVIVWIAVTFSLRPLYRLGDAIAERNPDDLHPIGERVPNEVQGLVDTVNSFMGGCNRRSMRCAISPATPAINCERRLRSFGLSSPWHSVPGPSRRRRVL